MIEVPTIEGLSSDQVASLLACRTLSQYARMLANYRAGKCPFCDPLDAQDVVLHESRLWRVWKNPFPCAHSSLHLILASKRHVAPRDAVTVEDFEAIGEIFCWASAYFHIAGGGLVMRFGLPELNSGSVLHLHANIIVPDRSGPVHATLAKESSHLKEARQRMAVFEKLCTGVRLDELAPEEQKLVEGRL